MPMPEATFARCCMTPWFNRTKLHVIHFTHFALNFDQLIAEPIEQDHFKNWGEIPNCDVDFYKAWKVAYHKAVNSK